METTSSKLDHPLSRKLPNGSKKLMLRKPSYKRLTTERSHTLHCATSQRW